MTLIKAFLREAIQRFFEKLLDKCEVLLNVDFIERKEFTQKAKTIIFTGTIDSYFDYKLGALEYRSLKFEHEILDMQNYQGVAVVNYTDFRDSLYEDY